MQQNLSYKIQIKNLKDENTRLDRKKKQFLTVIILSSLLLIGSVITAIVISDKNSDINNKITEIESLYQKKSSLESQINRLNNNIENLNEEIDELQREYSIEHDKYLEYKEKYDTLSLSISNRQPFVITHSSFNFDSGWFEIQYFGLTEGTYTIKINIYTDSGNRIRSEVYRDYTFYEGKNSKDFYITTSLISSDWYYFEVCIDNVIVGGRRH